MMDQNTLFSKMNDEMRMLKEQEKNEYLLKKVCELYELIEKQRIQFERLQRAFECSDVLFKMPEVEIITRSKLPRVVAHASDPVGLDANMYQLEHYNELPYRWFGPSRLTKLQLPIDRTQERTFILDLFSQITEGVYGSIKIYLDGDLVEHSIETSGDAAKIFVTLPVVDRVQDTVVAILCPKLFRPSEFDRNSADSRLVSVSFTKYEVL